MEEREDKPDVQASNAQQMELSVIRQQYRVVVDLVTKNQSRLDTIKIAFLGANFFILAAYILVPKTTGLNLEDWGVVDLKATLMFLPISGMVASVVWLAISMRLQLMQRLHYFQLRQLESQMGLDDSSGIFNQTSIYWSRKKLTSYDGKKVLSYPKGADGKMGRITFRVWAWLMPLWFFFVFFYCFLALLLHYA